jgi:hypothetical protein
MFIENLLGLDARTGRMRHMTNNKIVRTGWPMEYMSNTLDEFKGLTKRDLILFPHRVAPEKQVDIFKDLAKSMPQFDWVVCQEQSLSKDEYHKLLGESKMVFSANLQETLGISCYEGAVVDAVPFVPDRLSYSEMYTGKFKYPSEWTESWESYTKNKQSLIDVITWFMENYDSNIHLIKAQAVSLTDKFFSAQGLLENIE